MRSQTVAGLLTAVCLCGCPDPNTYGTPRTLAPGDFQLLAAYSGFASAANGSTALASGLPTVGLRTGLTNRLDVGARVVDLTALGGDAKLNFVRGRVDLAVDPIIRAFYGLPGMNTSRASPRFSSTFPSSSASTSTKRPRSL